jgi:ribosomal protein S18 acetylase RimI-like enzyme
MHTPLEYRSACPEDSDECIQLRGLTRQNAISVALLAQHGITTESWSASIRSNVLAGFLCVSQGSIVGYCFGDRNTGEVVVLALLPDFEDRGIGRTLLSQVVTELIRSGHTKLFLGCSSESQSRSYGFYRHLGWRTTGQFDTNGDEILKYQVSKNSAV